MKFALLGTYMAAVASAQLVIDTQSPTLSLDQLASGVAISVRLASQPNATVNAVISMSNALFVVPTCTLTFTPTNFNMSQEVRIYASSIFDVNDERHQASNLTISLRVLAKGKWNEASFMTIPVRSSVYADLASIQNQHMEETVQMIKDEFKPENNRRNNNSPLCSVVGERRLSKFGTTQVTEQPNEDSGWFNYMRNRITTIQMNHTTCANGIACIGAVAVQHGGATVIVSINDMQAGTGMSLQWLNGTEGSELIRYEVTNVSTPTKSSGPSLMMPFFFVKSLRPQNCVQTVHLALLDGTRVFICKRPSPHDPSVWFMDVWVRAMQRNLWQTNGVCKAEGQLRPVRPEAYCETGACALPFLAPVTLPSDFRKDYQPCTPTHGPQQACKWVFNGIECYRLDVKPFMKECQSKMAFMTGRPIEEIYYSAQTYLQHFLDNCTEQANGWLNSTSDADYQAALDLQRRYKLPLIAVPVGSTTVNETTLPSITVTAPQEPPCLNGGESKMSGGGCSCPAGYSGNQCEIDVGVIQGQSVSFSSASTLESLGTVAIAAIVSIMVMF